MYVHVLAAREEHLHPAWRQPMSADELHFRAVKWLEQWRRRTPKLGAGVPATAVSPAHPVQCAAASTDSATANCIKR